MAALKYHANYAPRVERRPVLEHTGPGCCFNVSSSISFYVSKEKKSFRPLMEMPSERPLGTLAEGRAATYDP